MSNKRTKESENPDSDIEEDHDSESEKDSDFDSDGNFVGDKVSKQKLTLQHSLTRAEIFILRVFFLILGTPSRF